MSQVPVALRGAAGGVCVEVRSAEPDAVEAMRGWWGLSPQADGAPPELAFEVTRSDGLVRLVQTTGPAPDPAEVAQVTGQTPTAVPGGVLLRSSRDLDEVLVELERSVYFGLVQVTRATPLHGAGVVLPGPSGAAHLLLGESGAGKSTLARALIERGAGYLGDEHLFLGDRGDVTGLVRLIRPAGEAATLPPEASWVTTSRPVARVVLLRAPRRAGAGLEPLAAGAAAAELAHHLHRRGHPGDLRRVVRLAGRIPAFALACDGVEAAVAALSR